MAILPDTEVFRTFEFDSSSASFIFFCGIIRNSAEMLAFSEAHLFLLLLLKCSARLAPETLFDTGLYDNNNKWQMPFSRSTCW